MNKLEDRIKLGLIAKEQLGDKYKNVIPSFMDRESFKAVENSQEMLSKYPCSKYFYLIGDLIIPEETIDD